MSCRIAIYWLLIGVILTGCTRPDYIRLRANLTNAPEHILYNSQENAIDELVNIGTYSAAQVLYDFILLPDRDYRLKRKALIGLGRIGTKDAKHFLFNINLKAYQSSEGAFDFNPGRINDPIGLTYVPEPEIAAKYYSDDKVTWIVYKMMFYDTFGYWLVKKTQENRYSFPILLNSNQPSASHDNKKYHLRVHGDIAEFEIDTSINKTDLSEATKDSDEDSLPDAFEMIIGTEPDNPDTDGDGIIDGKDSNPKSQHKIEREKAEIRQAVFTYLFFTQSTVQPLYVVNTDDLKDQEFYGHKGLVIHLDSMEKDAAKLIKLEVKRTSEETAEVHYAGYLGSMAAKQQVFYLKKIYGIWAIIKLGPGSIS